MKRTGSDWYMGTADAVYQNIYSSAASSCARYRGLAATLYKMDYSRMLEYHKETKPRSPSRPCPSPPTK